MSDVKEKTYADFVLPVTVVTRADVSRLTNDLERVDGELTAQKVRSKVASSEQPSPILSQQLSDFLEQNKLTIDDGHVRMDLIKQLRLLKDKVPQIHMTFAVTADPESLGEIAGWIRETVHPQAVIAVGLQPALVAGVYVRTPNHVHDLSLRGLLASQHGVLVKELETLRVVK